MAELTTSQKAPVVAVDDLGAVLAKEKFSCVSSDESVVAITPAINNSPHFAVAVSAGTATVVATSINGQVGSVEVTVTNPPLTVSLGEPVAK